MQLRSQDPDQVLKAVKAGSQRSFAPLTWNYILRILGLALRSNSTNQLERKENIGR